MNLQLQGRLDAILPIQSGQSKSGKDWQKQEFVIETEEQFPRKVCFTLFGDKIDLLKGFQPNEKVEVYFNVESREFNGKWYHNINAWKIEKSAISGNDSEIPEYKMEDIPGELPADNDLPF